MGTYEEISDADFADAIRYIDGATDDAAEDAYFEIERIAVSGVTDGLRILERLAAGVDVYSLGSLGAGLFENFLNARGEDDPAAIEDAIKGNARLLVALRGVRSLAVPFELALRLAPLVH